ncbi:flavin reductase family protein [Cellulomonas sp. URHE0023]|uniref:flavin reductase family protein n=1 Tax=Cellulomonas sp. URHE0023 TaxID=1380354 RepID=UPI000555E6C2|nr:flavin reductase family protein [Cellulomonas sp. URHE0023]
MTPHVSIDPSILYFGTPVVLVSTIGADGRPNLAPISSVFWLGHTAVIGLGRRSRTLANLAETGQCVLNLPSVHQVGAVDRLALTTGNDPVSARKRAVGYRYEPDKFGRAGVTPAESTTVAPSRVAECPVHLEATVTHIHALGGSDGGTAAVELTVTHVHVEESLKVAGTANRIDPDRWRPLIMSFQQFYGLGDRVRPSTLSSIAEEWYR